MSLGSIGGVYGLSGSGMDIDMVVKKLMMGQQAKSDALFQKKTIAQWQKVAYNTVYDDVSKFRDTMFNYKLEGTLSPNKVSSSNTSVATATVNANAVDVNHSLVVAQLASGVNLTSDEAISVTQPPTLGTLETQLGMPATSFNIKIANGTATSQAIIIDPATDTINDVVSKFNNAGVNVKAYYDSTLDRFFLNTTNTGASSGISFDGSDPDGLKFIGQELKLPAATTADGGVTYTSAPVQGLSAEFKLDGVHLTQARNTFSISGVTYNLTGESANVGTGTIQEKLAAGTPISVSVSKDTDKSVDSIHSLVDSYNKIIGDLNGRIKETRYRGFPPLTDAQRAELKESEITSWEEKAKSGMLRNDSTLASLVNSMRTAFNTPVSGITGSIDPATGKTITYNTGSSIGISTGADYLEGGKLYLDKDKLRKALEDNPEVLNQLFGSPGTTNPDGSTDFETQGIAGRLYDGIKKSMDQLKTIAGTTANLQFDTQSNFAKKLTEYNKQISNEARRFDNIQSSYYKQFNAMEVALQQLGSQGSWLQSFGTNS